MLLKFPALNHWENILPFQMFVRVSVICPNVLSYPDK